MELFVKQELNPDEIIEWSELWMGCSKSHAQQHYLHAGVEVAKGRKPLFLYGKNKGRIVAIGIFSIKPIYGTMKYSLEAYCLRGPVFEDIHCGIEFLYKAKLYFNSNKVGQIRISPHWHNQQAKELIEALKNNGFSPYYKKQDSLSTTGIVNLQDVEISNLIATFSKSARREISRAERQHVEIRPITQVSESLKFIKELNSMLITQRLTPTSESEFVGLFNLLLKKGDLGILLGAYKEKLFLGGLLLYRDCNYAHGYRFVVAKNLLAEISNLRLAPIIWFHAMTWAKGKGCHWLDLEGYDIIKDKTNRLYNIYKYKSEFNPTLSKRVSEHIQVCNYTTYLFYRFFTIISKIKRKLLMK
jgi:lipid II:glycine glycyltransferase (peptidoglycan interpeptide bridge formation enzyme)